MATQRKEASDRRTGTPAPSRAGEPDVLLDVPNLRVEEITLEVDNLHARIALEAGLADLVRLHVGADVRIERVALEIKGVEAQAQLKARLENVLAIIERTLDSVDQHPELLTELSRGVRDAAGEVGEGVGKLGELVEGGARATGSSPKRRRTRPRPDGKAKPDSGPARARRRR